jgi:hypothetical protein
MALKRPSASPPEGQLTKAVAQILVRVEVVLVVTATGGGGMSFGSNPKLPGIFSVSN